MTACECRNSLDKDTFVGSGGHGVLQWINSKRSRHSSNGFIKSQTAVSVWTELKVLIAAYFRLYNGLFTLSEALLHVTSCTVFFLFFRFAVIYFDVSCILLSSLSFGCIAKTFKPPHFSLFYNKGVKSIHPERKRVAAHSAKVVIFVSVPSFLISKKGKASLVLLCLDAV